MVEPDFRHARAIGEKLRTIRQQRQISLRKLAHKTDVSASMLSRIENGSAYPSVRPIYTFAAALSVPVDYFSPERGEDETSFPPAVSESATGLMTVSPVEKSKLNWPGDAATMEPIFFLP